MAARHPFVEDEDGSDTSSVCTASTAPDESDSEYSVEKILAQKLEGGARKYLVKWEGYPIAQCTWEPTESFLNDSHESLREWAEQKQKIRRGEARSFDVQRYDDAYAEAERQTAGRKAKRREKLRRRAEAAALTEERGTPIKKGIARVVKDSSARPSPTKSSGRKRKRVVRESPSPSPTRSVNDPQSSQWSLFNDPVANVPEANPSTEKPSEQPWSRLKRPKLTRQSASSSAHGTDAGANPRRRATIENATKPRKPVQPVATTRPTKNTPSGKEEAKATLSKPKGSPAARSAATSSPASLSRTASPVAMPEARSKPLFVSKIPAVASNTTGNSLPKVASGSVATPKATSSCTAALEPADSSVVTSKVVESSTLPKKRPVPDQSSGTAAKTLRISATQATDVTGHRSSDTTPVRSSDVWSPSETSQSKLSDKEAGQAVSRKKPAPSKAVVGAVETSSTEVYTAPKSATTTEPATRRVSNTSAFRSRPDSTHTAETETTAVAKTAAEKPDPVRTATGNADRALQVVSEVLLTRTSRGPAPLNSPAARPPAKDIQKSSSPNVQAPLRSVPGPRGSGTAPAKIFDKWAEPKKTKQRPRVSEFTPKDSVDPHFANLSLQNRYQSYGMNEQQPDPTHLTFVDPKTGKPLGSAESSSRQPPGPGPGTNVARPDRNLNKSLATSAPEPISAHMPEPRPASLSTRPQALYWDRKNMTCRFWLRSQDCRFGEQRCRYAHRMCEYVEPKRDKICSYWRDGHCQFTDEKCEYQHSYPPWSDGGVHLPERSEKASHDRRSESPDRGGLRQDEAERRGRTSRANTATRAHSPALASTSPEATASPATASAVFSKGHAGDQSAVQAPALPLTGSNATQPSSSSTPLQANDSDTNQQPLDDLFVAFEDPTPQVSDIPACLKITPSDSPTSTLDIRLVFDKWASPNKFAGIFGADPLFEARDVCLAWDFEKYWFRKDKSWASGSVVSTSQDHSVADYLKDYLLLSNTGMLVRHEEYIMLVYPTNAPQWDFLPNRGLETSGLRFHIQSAVPGTLEPIAPSSINPVAGDKSLFVSICEKRLNLKEEVIFASNGGKKLQKNVYMVFPSKDLPETKLIEAYFREVGAKVYHSSDTPLWPGFLKDGEQPESFIVFHPAMDKYWEIPGLHRILHNRSDNIFQVGPDKYLKSRPDAAVHFSCVRLFPSGRLLLITDDVFKYHPGQALKVLEKFERKASVSPQGGRNDRICARPGLLAWLGQLIDEDYERGVLVEGSDRIKVFQAAVRLSQLEANDTNVSLRAFEPAPSVLYSPPRNEIPDYQGLWDSSEEEATDWLVEWFCGYCVMEREHFRRFTVLYEQQRKPVQTPGLNELKDPMDWMAKAQHVKVTNPKRFLEQHVAREQVKEKVRVSRVE